MSFTFLNQLPSPAEIKEKYPLSDELKALKMTVFSLSSVHVPQTMKILSAIM